MVIGDWENTNNFPLLPCSLLPCSPASFPVPSPQSPVPNLFVFCKDKAI
ncbi:MAG: hypothetical protein ACKPBB_18730 [Sphaerospermopsis kisseleviana]